MCLAIALAAAATATSAAESADLYVSPAGNDAWSGRLDAPNAAKTDGPLATLDRARLAVRELRAKEPQRQKAIVVAIRGGMYPLAKTLVFEPADSGSPASPVIYQAYGDERPLLSAGVRITGWEVTPEGRWQVVLDDVKSGKWNFMQLFAGDQRRSRPRLPKQGYYAIADKAPPTLAGKADDRFVFSGDDLRGDWANLGDVEVLPFHNWSMSRLRIAKIDAEKKTVTFTGTSPTHDSWGGLAKGNRYLVENVREALSEPGQWYLDRPTGRLTYIPMPGEKPDETVVVAPRHAQAVAFFGDVKGKKWVHDIQFKGVTLAHTNWVLPQAGQAFAQAEIGLDSAVAAIGARNLVLDGCAVRHVGGYAMAFGVGCQHNRVENCEMVDMAGGGVKIGQAGSALWEEAGGVPRNDDELVSHHTIRNCLIAHGGRMHPAAVGVWIGHSPYNTLDHNDIYDFYYTAVSVGWVWGYAPSKAHHNDVGFNHMHTIGQAVLSDMGGVYTLGTSPGTRVHDNHIHDIQSFDYGGWGLYTDEGSTGVVMDNNLVYRTRTGSFHQHYGKENRIENNIFAFATIQQIQRTRTEPHLSFTFERNIVLWTKGPLLGSNWADNNFKLDRNVYWNAAGQPVKFPGDLDLKQWQAKRKQDEHSIVADPKFVAPDKDDYHLRPDSPALKVGFKPFDYTQAGRKSPPVLTKDLPPVPRAFESPKRAE
jgi:hypothetical protein